MVLVHGSVSPVQGLSREQALLREAQALQSRYWQSLILGLCLRADVMEGVQAALARGPASAPLPWGGSGSSAPEPHCCGRCRPGSPRTGARSPRGSLCLPRGCERADSMS